MNIGLTHFLLLCCNGLDGTGAHKILPTLNKEKERGGVRDNERKVMPMRKGNVNIKGRAHNLIILFESTG